MKGKKDITSNNIILKDEELENLTRELVKKSGEKGAKVSYLINAISRIWKEEFPAKKEEYTFNENEQEFSEKVTNFLEYYADDLLKLKRNIFDWHYTKKDFIERLHKILCAMYIVCEKEEGINQNNIKDIINKYYDYNLEISEDVILLYYFFYDNLYFKDDEKPIYGKAYIPYKNSINNMKDFQNFKQKYSSRVKVHKATVAAIWLINKYF